MWIGKGQGLLLHLNYLIRKMYFAAAYSEHDLIKIPVTIFKAILTKIKQRET